LRLSDEQLFSIFEKTDGECAYCEKQLAWVNYGRDGYRGAWQVDHRVPVSRGGTDHMNNLSAACVDCNQSKGDLSAREFMVSFETAPARKTDSDFWPAVATIGGLAFLWWLFFGRNGQRH